MVPQSFVYSLNYHLEVYVFVSLELLIRSENAMGDSHPLFVIIVAKCGSCELISPLLNRDFGKQSPRGDSCSRQPEQTVLDPKVFHLQTP
jgi:hypothetical protein